MENNTYDKKYFSFCFFFHHYTLILELNLINLVVDGTVLGDVKINTILMIKTAYRIYIKSTHSVYDLYKPGAIRKNNKQHATTFRHYLM